MNDSAQSVLGIIFSILGLALSPLNTHFRRAYSGLLDYQQIAYGMALHTASTNRPFSDSLSYSWISFFPPIFPGCSYGKLICTFDYLIVFVVGWIVIALLVLAVVRILQCCKYPISYQFFYTLYKAIYRWVFPPLLFYAIEQIFNHFRSTPSDQNFGQAIGIVVLILLVPFLEICGYAMGQKDKENTYKKWVEFWSHARMAGVMIVLAVSGQTSSHVIYGVYISYVAYDFVVFKFYIFAYKPIEKIVFFLNEVVLYIMAILFIHYPQKVITYHIDLILLVLTILFEIFTVVIRIHYRIKVGTEDLGLAEPRKKKHKNKEVDLGGGIGSQNIQTDSVIGSVKDSNNRLKGSEKKRGKFGNLRGNKGRKNSQSENNSQSANSLSSNQQVVFRRRIF